MATAKRYFLLELEGFNPATQAVEIVRFTDGPDWITEPDDDPPDARYFSALVLPDDIVFGRSLFADGRTGGGAEIEISDNIRIINRPDAETGTGRWDHLADWGWDGRRGWLYRIDEGQGRADAVLVLYGVLEQLLPEYRIAAGSGTDHLVVRLKDPLSQLDRPLQPAKYDGSNVGPDGVEGTELDIKGLPKPVSWGRCYEVPGRPVNTSLLLYQFADGALAEIEPTWDKGLELTLADDYATPALLGAASVDPGDYATALAFGMAMPGAPPDGAVTANTSTVATPLPSGDAVQLDGSTEFFAKASGVTGAPTTDRGVVSAWFRVDGGDGTERTLLELATGPSSVALELWLGTDDKLHAAWVGAGGGAVASVVSTSAFAAAADWRHLALAWIFPATGSPYLALWVDGANQTNPTITGTGPFDPLTAIRVGAFGRTSQTQHFPGALAELWVAWNQFLDITISDGLERLRTLTGYPTDLGPSGARPTGYSPAFYLRGGPAAFGTNLGVGGDLTASGTPTLADSTPYAPPPATPSTVVAAEIIRDIITSRVGLGDDQIDDDAFDAATIAAPEEIGLWVGEEASVRDILDLVSAHGIAYWFRQDGRFAIGRFQLPSGSPVHVFTTANVLELERTPTADSGFGVPVYSVVVEHSRIYQVATPNSLADSVDAARRAYLEREYRRASASDNTVKAKHLLATELVIRTLITDADDAQAYADAELALRSTIRPLWRVRAPITAETAAIDLFDVVMLRLPRFGLVAGKLFRVIGVAAAPRPNWVEFQLWGGVDGPISVPFLGNRVTIHPPTVIGSAATITVPYLGNRVTIHAPRIGLYLRPPFLGSRVAIHAPTVSTSYGIAVPFLGSRSTVHAPSVLRGGVAVEVPALGNRATIHAPTVLPGGVAVEVPFLGLRATLHGPTVSAAYRVQVPALGNRVTVHAPTLVYDQAVQVPFLGSRVTVHSPVVQSGNTFVVVPYLGKRVTIHAPAVTAGYTVQVPALGNRVTLHAPAVTARYAVQVPFLGGRATLHAPTVTASYSVQVPFLGSRVSVHAPTVVPDQFVAVPFLGSRATLHAPTVAATYRIQVPALGNRITIHEPAVLIGDLRLTEAGDTRITEAGDARELE
ncbi:hypothetical protein STAQ_27600 [Allostella sp. ATCC 35155]|nr:hypothetical protein STAQ_27600 [Stella sp. ATCC 35155]